MQLTVRNAHANNLKGIDLTIPHHKLVVITGVSGSGKSSLAFDVIANAGKTEFLQSIPSYARKFGGKRREVKVGSVEGLFPVVTVEQSAGTPSSKSTFGTLSDTYDLMRLLFARFGKNPEPTVQLTRSLFSFNTKEGACSNCYGIGLEEYISIEKLIADPSKSLRDGALVPTQPNGYTMYSQVTVDALNEVCEAHGFNVDIPWNELSQAQIDVVLYGSERVKIPFGKHSEASRLKWTGIKAKPREKGFYRGMIPIMTEILKRDRNKNILRFVDASTCSVCEGARLSQTALNDKWKKKSIFHFASLPLQQLQEVLANVELTSKEQLIVDELSNLIADLSGLGLGHHSMSTEATKLSQGEIQRVRLINQLRAGLSNVLYVFDEPGIGLHPAFQKTLIRKFQQLVADGNSVILVEHSPVFIQSADWIIEIGPKAGANGGELLFNGSLSSFLKSGLTNSSTLNLLLNHSSQTLPEPQKSNSFIEQGSLTVVTGLNGSGKHAFVERELNAYKGHVNRISRGPIGKTARSNPATYTGLSEVLRNVFAALPESKTKGLKRTHFSFNTNGGRCETCLGAGVISVGMSYLGNVDFVCETCNGRRFKGEILQVKFNGKSIADIYELTVEEALHFFGERSGMYPYLNMLESIGLGYLVLGQSSSTLSGGEAQRLKLAARLMEKKSGVIVLDEPTNGLHDYDLGFLKATFDKLLAKGYALICIDFNAKLLSWANKVIELETQGQIRFDGLYADMLDSDDSPYVKSLQASSNPSVPARHQHKSIELKGVRTHNLKAVDVKIPHQKLSSVIGRSGSGKSSLVIATLHAVSNERFVNGLSAYQRHFVPVVNASDIDSADGLTPSIAITKKNEADSAWEIVAKSMGIYEKLRFLFSRAAALQGQDVPASSFNFTNSSGACPICGGKGTRLSADHYKLAPNWNLSPLDGAFNHSKTLAYYGAPESQFFALLKALSEERGIDLTKPLNDLSDEELELMFNGDDQSFTVDWHYTSKTRSGNEKVTGNWKGLSTYINEEYLARKENKNISGITALMSEKTCGACKGKRLNKSVLEVTIESKNIANVLSLNLDEFGEWVSRKREDPAIEKVFLQFRESLVESIQVGQQLDVNYLSLDRKVSTLSGGEYQRIKLAEQLGQPLIGLTVVLDEPCSGLDTEQCKNVIALLKNLRDKGNTVISISHRPELIQASDYVIELGPGAGGHGGEVLRQYEQSDAPLPKASLNEVFLPKLENETKRQEIYFHHPQKYTLDMESAVLLGRAVNRITGKSGAGKSTLLEKVIIPSISTHSPINCERISDTHGLKEIFALRQHNRKPSPMETVLTFSSLFEHVQKQFVKEAKKQGRPFKKAHFDYRTKDGRCPVCEGSGKDPFKFDLLSEKSQECERCEGLRFVSHIDIEVNLKTISEVMTMSVEELLPWLSELEGTNTRAQSIVEIGLAHLKLGQAIDSLSFGELQRLRLALIFDQKELSNTLIALDEPTQGLHQLDINLLLTALKGIVKKGGTVVLIDHHPCFDQFTQHEIHVPTPER